MVKVSFLNLTATIGGIPRLLAGALSADILIYFPTAYYVRHATLISILSGRIAHTVHWPIVRYAYTTATSRHIIVLVPTLNCNLLLQKSSKWIIFGNCYCTLSTSSVCGAFSYNVKQVLDNAIVHRNFVLPLTEALSPKPTGSYLRHKA